MWKKSFFCGKQAVEDIYLNLSNEEKIKLYEKTNGKIFDFVIDKNDNILISKYHDSPKEPKLQYQNLFMALIVTPRMGYIGKRVCLSQIIKISII